MACVDINQDGKIDVSEFTDRFHNPAKENGFNVAVLFTNLKEHIPADARLERLLEKAKPVLDYFEPFIGIIEIIGKAERVERLYFEIKEENLDQWSKPQIRDSKRSFLHSAVGEEDKEKLEAFTSFCEDTIFEMQHAASLSYETQVEKMSGKGGLAEQGGIIGGVSMVFNAFMFVINIIFSIIGIFSWSNLKTFVITVSSMTFSELIIAFFKLQTRLVIYLGGLAMSILGIFFKFIWYMMMGRGESAKQVDEAAVLTAAVVPPCEETVSKEKVLYEYSALDKSDEIEAFGLRLSKTDDNIIEARRRGYSDGEVTPLTPAKNVSTTLLARNIPPPTIFTDIPEVPALHKKDDEAETGPKKAKKFDYLKFVLSFFARNYYSFKIIALVIAFLINFMLLFYKIEIEGPAAAAGEEAAAEATTTGLEAGGEEGAAGGVGGEEEEADPFEWLRMKEEYTYMESCLKFLAMLHSLISFMVVCGYYNLKIPLVIFKREKEISRQMEFEGKWIAEQPADDDLAGHWDKLVLSTTTFPGLFWDRFVKKKVLVKYSDSFSPKEIREFLGLDKKKPPPDASFLQSIDWQYEIWKWGVIFSDSVFLYNLWYFLFSVAGNFSYFLFACHLIDLAVTIKNLKTILQSVTHNGKQLMLTTMLVSVVVYLYSVIAFNVFRKFYASEDDEGVKDYKCHDMMNCYMFHIYKGVTSGGGIGDVIDEPFGDSQELLRIVFDFSFFFFVIVILMAILQGLIIDAFGELRDQLEQVLEDLEAKCFICGIGKDYFDSIPHGFELHCTKEHNFANYMFFLMYLIDKDETEYTGQETTVWEMYQERNTDFFPTGVCFRQQNEEALNLGG